MNRLEKIKEKVQEKKGERNLVLRRINENEKKLKKQKVHLQSTIKAKSIIRKAALDTQKEFEVYISDIVTSALNAVFDEPYEFKINFTERRGKTEADLFFVKDGNEVNPIVSSGLGAVDIASCALRVACWGLAHDKPRNVLVLDEPFKHLSTDKQGKAAAFLKALAYDSGIQIIYISHTANKKSVIKHADKIFHVSKKKGVSVITEYEPNYLLNN